MMSEIIEHFPPIDLDNLQHAQLKREIIKALPWDSKATEWIMLLSPKEIFDLIPKKLNPTGTDYGLFFENVAKRYLLIGQTGSQKKIQSILGEIFKKIDFTIHIPEGYSIPDFLGINENSIEEVYECKASAEAKHSKIKQRHKTMNFLPKLMAMLIDPNPIPKLLPYIEELKKSHNFPVTMSQKARYAYVLPSNMKSKEREAHLTKQGIGWLYIPFTADDSKAIIKVASEIYTQGTESSTTKIISSGFRKGRS